MSLYTPILVLGVIAAAFAVVSVVIALVVGPRRYNRAKLEAYECGIEPMAGEPAGGSGFPIKYYLTAMLFIVFDIEIVFLYPWAVAFDRLGTFGLVEMLIFMATVFVAYAYVWRAAAGGTASGTRRKAAGRHPAVHGGEGGRVRPQGVRCGRRRSAWRAAPSR